MLSSLGEVAFFSAAFCFGEVDFFLDFDFLPDSLQRYQRRPKEKAQ